MLTQRGHWTHCSPIEFMRCGDVLCVMYALGTKEDLRYSCEQAKPEWNGSLVVIDDGYESQWLADHLRAEGHEDKRMWVRYTRVKILCATQTRCLS